jgi:uncharacterized transporter YbjL
MNVILPNPIKIESTGSGGSVSGLLTLLGILATAAVSLWAANKANRAADLSRNLTSDLAEKERGVRLEIAKAELKIKEMELQTKKDQFEKEQEENKQHNALVHKQTVRAYVSQYELDLKRLGLQSSDAYLAATRLEHEQRVAEAEVVHSLSEKLLSEKRPDRLFALLVLSEYVRPQIISRLAAGGTEIVSDDDLKKLAALDDPKITDVVRSIMKLRQPEEPKHT